MTNNELRHKIAEARGWTIIDEQSHIGVKDKSGLSAYEFIPNWPVNIVDAWELVEEMATPDNFGLSFWDKNIWECIYHKDEDHSSFVEADTAPRAICLAYIAYKESQK